MDTFILYQPSGMLTQAHSMEFHNECLPFLRSGHQLECGLFKYGGISCNSRALIKSDEVNMMHTFTLVMCENSR